MTDHQNITFTIRTAVPEDAPGLLDIYAPYVKNTAVTFEYEVPSLEEFTARISQTLKNYPWLAATDPQGRIVGYAYASAFHPRAAYAWAAETSIYVDSAHRLGGIGSALYAELESVLRRQNVLNVNACISCPNPASVAFHERFGYRTTAHFHQCGYKFGTWYDTIWMEKHLGAHGQTPLPFIPFPRLNTGKYT